MIQNSKYTPRVQSLVDALSQRILILDGAMGTMIQRFGLTENDFRPAGHDARVIMQGCNDILTITRPDVIQDIHRQYVEAGADIIETCTFNANALSLEEYALEGRVSEINRAGARLAREVADAADRMVWVAGCMGPTGKSLTMAVNLGDSTTFDVMEQAYFSQAKALIEGGVDLLLIETVFDTLNAKAAIHAAQRAMEQLGVKVPLMLSVTLSENGRTLSGQSLDAFVVSIAHADPLIVSMNCGFGPESMGRYIEQLQDIPYAVAMYPNAGLPNKMGQYDQDPETMGRAIEPLLQGGRLNIVGGCCGTTPDHIRRMASIAAGCKPRVVPAPVHETRLAGLEPLVVSRASNLVNIGERCNVAGSRKFLRLIKEGAVQEALEIASGQVANGAQAVDVNMDDGMLDAVECMSSFVARLQVEPDVAVVPMVIDSSKSDVIMAGLKRVQGKPLVNSISLKEGEEAFLNMARAIHRLGAAMVVMAFDEQGQATTLQRRVEICTRAYKLLTEKAGIPPYDIVFDPNILTIATGMPEHDSYALDFINAVRIIKETLPGAKTCGGVSNLSFAFRGNNYLREAMHAVFLYHAVAAGLDMAIVNAASLMAVDDIDPALREAIEDLLFIRRPDAVDRLTQLAAVLKESHTDAVATKVETKTLDPEKRLENLIIKGSTLNLEEVLGEVARRYDRVADLIDGPLMSAMDTVGRLFGEGRLFLPQVVKSAGVMKNAVAILEPRLEQERAVNPAGASRRCIVLATVKGDVHDIGKNIVSVIMKCNGWNVVDLGVMVPPDKILDAVVEHNADAVGLSGLITPSLDEMCRVARMMQERGLSIPLFIGGATTSARHTAVKIAPCREGVTVYTRDAARVPVIASRLVSPATALAETLAIKAEQEAERKESDNSARTLLSLDDARRRAAVMPEYSLPGNRCTIGVAEYDFAPSQLRGLINTKALLFAWKLDPALPQAPEARKLIESMNRLLDRLEAAGYRVRARTVTEVANVDLATDTLSLGVCRLPMLRSQVPDKNGNTLSVVDFINPDGSDVMTAFTVTAPEIDSNSDDEFDRLLGQSVSHRLVEAATELLHRTLSTPDASDKIGVRPAVGYAMMPDQSLVFELDKLLKYGELNIALTEHGALHPSATTTGLIIYNPAARYFEVGHIDETQLNDYAARRGTDVESMRGFLASVL